MNSALLDMAFTASNVLRLYLLRIMEAMPTVLGAVALLLVFWFGGRYAAGWVGRAIARMGGGPPCGAAVGAYGLVRLHRAGPGDGAGHHRGRPDGAGGHVG